jgi:hypothetical protein
MRDWWNHQWRSNNRTRSDRDPTPPPHALAWFQTDSAGQVWALTNEPLVNRHVARIEDLEEGQLAQWLASNASRNASA